MASNQHPHGSIGGEATYEIKKVASQSDLSATIALFTEYANSLPVNLSYQNFEEEMASMPGKYSTSTGGCLLLARETSNGQNFGCVALRAMPGSCEQGKPTCCEMKRLYVAPNGRGRGLGRALALAIIDEAARLGYREMRLDSLPSMIAAIALYEALGFKRIGAYYDTPIEGTVFMSKDLSHT